MPGQFNPLNFLHSGAGGQQAFGGGLNIAPSGPGGLGGAQQGGSPPATQFNVDALRTFILGAMNPQRLTGSGGFLSQSDPIASDPFAGMLARMAPGFPGGGGAGGPGGPGGGGAGGGGGQR